MPGTVFSSLLVLVLSCSQGLGEINQPTLSYDFAALEPYISRETVQTHYEEHHGGYVNKVNDFIQEDEECLGGKRLWTLMLNVNGTFLDNVAQVYNHNMYWLSVSPEARNIDMPSGNLSVAIDATFGSYDNMREEFTSLATSLFGSGYVWLYMTKEGGEVYIAASHDGSNPSLDGLGFPLFACDVWEHAYYLDVKNDRATYIDNFWKVADWGSANSEYDRLYKRSVRLANDAAAAAAAGALEPTYVKDECGFTVAQS